MIRDRTGGHEPACGFGHREGEHAVGHVRAGPVVGAPGNHVLHEGDGREVPAHRLREERRGHEVEGALAHAGGGVDCGPEVGVEPQRLRGADAAHRALRVEEIAQRSIEVELRGRRRQRDHGAIIARGATTMLGSHRKVLRSAFPS
jgi:hypothetical protein